MAAATARRGGLRRRGQRTRRGGLRSVVVLIDPGEVVDADVVVREATGGAERLGMQPHVVEMHGAEGVDAAFAVLRRHRPQALFPIAMYPHRARIAALAANDRLPTVGESSEEARAGFLLAYGVDFDELIRRGVAMLDKILRGERAGELPIERPAKLRLSINQKTARAIGVVVPPSLLARADEVIA